MAANLEKEIRKNSNFEITHERKFGLVCFRLKGTDDQNKLLVEQLNSSGKMFCKNINTNKHKQNKHKQKQTKTKTKQKKHKHKQQS